MFQADPVRGVKKDLGKRKEKEKEKESQKMNKGTKIFRYISVWLPCLFIV